MVDVAEQYPGQLAEHPSGPRSSMRRFVRRRSTIAVLMCVPLIVIVAGLIIYPALYSIYLSMLNKAQTRFVGLDNFSYLLKRDTFWMVVQQSAIFALSAVFFKALIGLVTAHLVNNLPSKGQRKWRGMLLVPWVIPLALSTLGWWWLFDPTHSAFNWMIKGFGGSEIPWLSDPYWVTFANFDIVQIMTAGGPRNMTHVFATYAFLLGIRSGDLPLGAAVSLFMFPILAFSAVFILRGVRKRGRAIG